MRSVIVFVTLFVAAVAQAQIVVRDDTGHALRLAQPAQRVVSLAPHLTELLFAAGAGAQVVGVLRHSDFPPEARALPLVGDDAALDLERILALRPDLALGWPSAGHRRQSLSHHRRVRQPTRHATGRIPIAQIQADRRRPHAA